MPFDTTRPDFLAEAREIVAAQQARRDRFVPNGVCWSAMAPEPPVVETVEAVAARLEQQHAKRQAYLATPEGRFMTAALAIYEATGGDDRLLGCHSRGLATNFEHAERLLATMEGPAADEARQALAVLEASQ